MNEEINKIIDRLDGCIGMFDYLITPIESNLLVSYIKELQQENQLLKKQLENKYSRTGTLTNEVLYEENIKLINQQKEFIDWLSNTIKEMENTPADDIHQQLEKDSCLAVADTILLKYNEIIGDKE